MQVHGIPSHDTLSHPSHPSPQWWPTGSAKWQSPLPRWVAAHGATSGTPLPQRESAPCVTCVRVGTACASGSPPLVWRCVSALCDQQAATRVDVSLDCVSGCGLVSVSGLGLWLLYRTFSFNKRTEKQKSLLLPTLVQ